MEIRDFENEEKIKVNCSFCGKEIECPKSMIEEANRHMCFDCLDSKDWSNEDVKDVHLDIPMEKLPEFMSSEMADKMVGEMFPKIWSDKKAEFKEMSKKELAEMMFGTGVYLGIRSFLESMQKTEKEHDKGKK